MAQSGCLPISSLLIGVRRQSATRRRCGGSCPSAVRTTPSVRQGCSGHRQICRRSLAVVHGLAFSNGWRRTWTFARIKCHTGSPPAVGLQAHVHQAECLHITQREFRHAKLKHPEAKQGLLVLISCFFSPQFNFSVNGTPTSLLASARPCGRPLPRALGSLLMRTNQQLQDRIHAEILLGCDANNCDAIFIASEPICEPIEVWSSRATAEAQEHGWSVSAQNQCFYPAHEPLAAKVSRIAQSLLDGRTEFLESLRALSALRFLVSREGNDSDFALFVGIDSQTDHLPKAAVRGRCTAEWLAKCDEEELQTAIFYKASIEEACHRLIKRFNP